MQANFPSNHKPNFISLIFSASKPSARDKSGINFSENDVRELFSVDIKVGMKSDAL